MGLLSALRTKNDNKGITDTPINEASISKATELLQTYRAGKVRLEARIIENEDFWKKRQYDIFREPGEEFVPASAWLWNCIENKHAQLVEAYPAFNILPRQSDDVAEAKVLSTILPIVLKQAGYPNTYNCVSGYKVKQGTGVTGVFWDGSANNGYGDIVIKKADLLNIFWEPGVSNIQDSPHLFVVTLVDNDALRAEYPEFDGKFGTGTLEVAQYNYDDNVDTSTKTAVVEWYYKKRVKTQMPDGTVIDRVTLQYVKYVNTTVLYATENDTEPVTDDMGNIIRLPLASTGLYADAKYPYVFDPLFLIEGSPAGYGYTDIGKDTQIQIDALNNAIVRNATMSCKPRWFARENCEINTAEFANWNNDFVRVSGSGALDQDLQQIAVNPLGGVYVNILDNKINELKETLGNRDVNTGGSVSGVTAASAIAALQEAGGRIDRAVAQATYDAQEEIARMVIDRIEQFYTTQRFFRILDDNGKEAFIAYKSQLAMQVYPALPYYDIEITAEQASPYKKISQNELMLQLYSAGFFAPGNAVPALACLEGMDFDDKDQVIDRIQANNTMMQQLIQLAALVDNAYGTAISSQLGVGTPAPAPVPEAKDVGEEPKHMQNAREQAQEVGQPR